MSEIAQVAVLGFDIFVKFADESIFKLPMNKGVKDDAGNVFIPLELTEIPLEQIIKTACKQL